jgi:hypothetical protein
MTTIILGGSKSHPGLKAFMADFAAGTEQNPLAGFERIWNASAGFEVSIFNGAIRLAAIRSLERSKGHGSRALDWLCELADRHGVAISAKVSPFGDGPKLDTKQLRAWYRRRGFNIERNGNMRRSTNATKTEYDGMADHSPGLWEFREYLFDDAQLADMRKHGIEPIRTLMNDGGAVVMSGPPGAPDRHRICVVDCQSDYKKGQGHVANCPTRDANARLIAASPKLKLALQNIMAFVDAGKEIPGDIAHDAHAVLAEVEG